jgi:hypothetical protein
LFKKPIGVPAGSKKRATLASVAGGRLAKGMTHSSKLWTLKLPQKVNTGLSFVASCCFIEMQLQGDSLRNRMAGFGSNYQRGAGQ